jgi:transposase
MLKKYAEIESARKLRINGYSINHIAQELKVSKGSVSLWVRDIQQPEKFTKEYRAKEKKERKKIIRQEREKNRRVKKDRILSGAGYWMIPIPENYMGKKYPCGYIYEHRYILEQKIGKYLTSNEIAHHINGNKLDNRSENLEVIIKQKHDSYHSQLKGKITIVLKCPECKKIFERSKRKTRMQNNTKYTTCSSSCRGKFSRKIQLFGETGETRKAIEENIIKEYRKFPDSTPL